MKRPVRLIVCGASGRMGARVAALASADPRFSLAATLSRASSRGEAEEAAARADVFVDFSAPDAAIHYAAAAAAAKKAFVSGTTGLSPVQQAQLQTLSRKTAVFLSPNFSPGVFVLTRLAASARALLPGFDVAVAETHHAAKKDAPSGTAKRLAEAVGGAPISSQRLGDVVGEHTVTFAGPSESLELTHRARSRDVFAKGALEAACWCAARKPGLYTMEDLWG